MKITGRMRALNAARGAVRVEEVYDTDIQDLWQACTTPERLARWIAKVSGELRVGATVQLLFASTWAGAARIESCDAPHHLLLTTQPGTEEEGQIEVWLTAEGARSRLVLEERGLPLDGLHFYGSGWQAHLEDLQRSLASGGSAHPDGFTNERPSPAWRTRWTELTAEYERMAVDS